MQRTVGIVSLAVNIDGVENRISTPAVLIGRFAVHIMPGNTAPPTVWSVSHIASGRPAKSGINDRDVALDIGRLLNGVPPRWFLPGVANQEQADIIQAIIDGRVCQPVG